MPRPSVRGLITLFVSVALVGALALWLRVAYFHITLIDETIAGDALYHVQQARQWLHGDQPEAGQLPALGAGARPAPAYAAYLAAIMLFAERFDADFYQITVYSQCLLGALACVLTLLLGRRFLPHCWALFAGLLACLSPHLVSIGTYLLPENLFCLLLLLSLYLFVTAFSRQKAWLYLASGCSFGLAYLANPVSLFLPVVLALGAGGVLHLRQHRAMARALPLLCLLPMLLFALALPPGEAAALRGDTSDRAQAREAVNDQTASDGSAPGTAGNLAQNLRQFWDWELVPGEGEIYAYPVFVSMYHTSRPAILSYSILEALHKWLVLFLLPGALLLAMRHRLADDRWATAFFAYLVGAYFSVVYSVGPVQARYSIPLRPELYLCSAYFLYRLLGGLLPAGKPSDAPENSVEPRDAPSS